MPEHVDICLALTPYAAVERPSIAFGLLQASLRGSEMTSHVAHTNLWFAESLGLRLYKAIEGSSSVKMIGEWTFGESLFADFSPDHDEFLDTVALSPRTCGGMDASTKKEFRELLIEARGKATEFIEHAADRLLQMEPKIVACSSLFQQHVASLALLQRIRRLAPQVVTMIGGPNCAGPMGLATVRAFPFVDYVVSGEADVLFPGLCRLALEFGHDAPAATIPTGVMSRSSARDLTPATVASAVVPDMSLVPMPDYDDYFEAVGASPFGAAIKPTLLIETSRGCWWGQKHHCTFCGLMNGDSLRYRSKPAARVVDEFEQIATRYGITDIEVVDNILDHRFVGSVMPALAQSEHDYFIFFESKANLRADDLERLARAGVRVIQPGIEALHDKALRALGKGTTTAINIQLLKWAQRFGIYVMWQWLIGIPGERDAWYCEMAELFPLLTHLQPPTGIGGIEYHRFSGYVDRAAEFGLDLIPGRAYQYVYPFPPETIAQLAFFFDDRDGSQTLDRSQETMPPGLRAALHARAKWWHGWLRPLDFVGRGRPELRMTDDGEQITIIDTRPVATDVFWELTPLESRIYRVCDSAHARPAIIDAVRRHDGSVRGEDIAAALERLVDGKLMVALDARYLSLAVEDPQPVTDRLPFGHIDWQTLGWTEKQMPSIGSWWL